MFNNLVLDTGAMANKLVELRGKRTQDEVAKALNISKSALAMYESGKRIPRDPVKIRIAQFYNRSVPFIFLTKKNTKCEWRREVRETEIRSLEIDFDRDVLMINGKDVTDKPVIVTLPGPEDSFPYRKLFNPELATGRKEECDRLVVTYEACCR